MDRRGKGDDRSPWAGPAAAVADLRAGDRVGKATAGPPFAKRLGQTVGTAQMRLCPLRISLSVIPGRASARTRNPFDHKLRGEMDSGLDAGASPPNDDGARRTPLKPSRRECRLMRCTCGC